MNFSQQFIEIMDAVGKKFGLAIDWTSKNVTPYLQDLSHRIVNYEIATSCVWFMVMGFLPMVATISIAKKLIKDAKNDKECDAELVGMVMFIACVCLVIPIWVMMSQSFDIIQALTLPEKTILEFVNGLNINIPSLK